MRYQAVLPFVAGQNVFDYGCGVGHGSYLLSRVAANVIGCDRSYEAVEEAKRRFGQVANLRFVHNVGIKMFGHIDTVLSIEVIEHLERQDLEVLISDSAQVAPSFICTTPDGHLFPYRPGRPEDRVGYHVWHYRVEELEAMLRKSYRFVVTTGCAFDPALGRFTGILVYASNMHSFWSDRWLTEVDPK